MSWHFEFAGTRERVKELVTNYGMQEDKKNAQLEAVKQLVIDEINRMPEKNPKQPHYAHLPPAGVYVKGHGYHDSNNRSFEIVVKPVEI